MKKYKYLVGYVFTIPFGIMTIIMGTNMYFEEKIINAELGFAPPDYTNIIIGIGLFITAQIIGKIIEIKIKE
jgi:hypothetical protein